MGEERFIRQSPCLAIEGRDEWLAAAARHFA
jgi:hypothetical protein